MERVIKKQKIEYAYKAFDGKEFHTEKECLDYEETLLKNSDCELGKITKLYNDYYGVIYTAFIKNKASYIKFAKEASSCQLFFEEICNKWQNKFKNNYVYVAFDKQWGDETIIDVGLLAAIKETQQAEVNDRLEFIGKINNVLEEKE